MAAAPAASAAASGTSQGFAAPGSTGSSTTRYLAAGQQLIYTAQLTVRASNVQAAVSRATSVVSAAGGYVSSENVTAAPPGHPSQASAHGTG